MLQLQVPEIFGADLAHVFKVPVVGTTSAQWPMHQNRLSILSHVMSFIVWDLSLAGPWLVRVRETTIQKASLQVFRLDCRLLLEIQGIAHFANLPRILQVISASNITSQRRLEATLGKTTTASGHTGGGEGC